MSSPAPFSITLSNHTFENLCEDDTTKSWIENAQRLFAIYFVTGILTVMQAEVRVGVQDCDIDVAPSGATKGFGDTPDLIGFVVPDSIIGVQQIGLIS